VKLELESALKATKFLIRSTSQKNLRVGTSTQTVEQVAENVISVLQTLSKSLLPTKYYLIVALNVSGGPSLNIWKAEDSQAVSVASHKEFEEKKTEDNKPVETEGKLMLDGIEIDPDFEFEFQTLTNKIENGKKRRAFSKAKMEAKRAKKIRKLHEKNHRVKR